MHSVQIPYQTPLQFLFAKHHNSMVSSSGCLDDWDFFLLLFCVFFFLTKIGLRNFTYSIISIYPYKKKWRITYWSSFKAQFPFMLLYPVVFPFFGKFFFRSIVPILSSFIIWHGPYTFLFSLWEGSLLCCHCPPPPHHICHITYVQFTFSPRATLSLAELALSSWALKMQRNNLWTSGHATVWGICSQWPIGHFTIRWNVCVAYITYQLQVILGAVVA